ncbi:hypothetical protein [Streptomyces mobaraensis]|uniref:hypothetical protein n=1 Tax=Streptomyces mobaraensis TaxID=35621 RepID=UPI0013DEE9C3|nr:hypothetical protein [Streptomyces mobaraensis]
MPLGHAFSVVRLSAQAAEDLIAWSRDFCVGPVFAHDEVAYVVVPVSSARQPWPKGLTFLGEGSWVTVPAPQCTRRGPRGLRWLRRPQEAGWKYTAPAVIQQVVYVCCGNGQQPQPP